MKNKILNLQHNKLFLFVLLFLIALFYFHYAFHLSILNPENINWLFKHSDSFQHYLAWDYFRKEEWHFPPGLIYNFNLAQPLSIGITDALPLLAFLFKPFDSFLPETFQYFGFYIFINVFLQLYFGFLLGKLITNNFILQLLVAVFLMLFPPFLYRLYYHAALASHWLLLAAIFIYQKPYSFKNWFILTALSAFIHPYLMTMLFVLMFFNLFSNGKFHIQTRFVHFLICAVFSLFISYCVGQFVNGGASVYAGGFGYYSVNLLSFLDSNWFGQHSFSIPFSIDEVQHNDGTQYLGLGILFLMPIVFYCFLRNCFIFKFSKFFNLNLNLNHPPAPIFNSQNKFLFTAAFLMALFALATPIYFFQTPLMHLDFFYNLPIIFEFSHMFRASGRFAWILFYLLTLFILGYTIRTFKTKTSIFILFVALVIQILDLNIKHKTICTMHQTASPNAWAPFPFKEWQQYAPPHAHLILITQHTAHQEFGKYVANWHEYFHFALNPAYFAQKNNMPMNYNFSRTDLDLDLANQFMFDHLERLKKGNPAPNTLYIFLPDYSPTDLKNILPESIYQQLLFQNHYALLPIQSKTNKIHGQL